MRRGMYLPASTSCQAVTSSSSMIEGKVVPSGPGTSLSNSPLFMLALLRPCRRSGRCRNQLHPHFPALRGGHSRPVRGLAHEPAGWRAVGDEDHPGGDLAILAKEGGLTDLGANSNGGS